MQKKHASIKYIYSRVTIYYNNKIELRWRRSIHHCASCDIEKLKELGLKCGAIHYGLCTGVAGAPTVAVQIPVLAITNKRLPSTAAREANSEQQVGIFLQSVRTSSPLHPASVYRRAQNVKPGHDYNMTEILVIYCCKNIRFILKHNIYSMIISKYLVEFSSIYHI